MANNKWQDVRDSLDKIIEVDFPMLIDGYYGDSGTYELDITGDATTITYTIDLTDDYGDGWNGGYMDVTVAGVVVLDDIFCAASFDTFAPK